MAPPDWGRGTNRVIEACNAHGIAPPEFADEAGVVTVTFKVDVVPNAVQGPSRDQVGTKSGPSRDQVHILEIAMIPKSIQDENTSMMNASSQAYEPGAICPVAL